MLPVSRSPTPGTGSSHTQGNMTSEAPSKFPDSSGSAHKSEETEKLSVVANAASSYSDTSNLPRHQSDDAHVPCHDRHNPNLNPLPATALTSTSLPSVSAFSDERSVSNTLTGAHNFRVDNLGIVNAAGNIERSTQYNLYLFSFGMCFPCLLLDTLDLTRVESLTLISSFLFVS